MVATMIGIGPHEMTTWGWIAMVGLSAFWTIVAIVTVVVVARILGSSGRGRV